MAKGVKEGPLRVPLSDYFDAFEAVLHKHGLDTKRTARALHAIVPLGGERSMAIIFKTARYGQGDFLSDFHDARHADLLARMIGRRAKPHDVWIYVERLELTQKCEFFGKIEPDTFFDIETRAKLRAAARSLDSDLPGRLMREFKTYRLDRMLVPESRHRDGNMATWCEPVGGAINPDRLKPGKIKDPIRRAALMREMSLYWRRGGLIDLAALLVLERYDEARWLIERMPKAVSIDQGYLIGSERFTDAEWQCGRDFATRVLVDLKKGKRPELV